MKKHFHVYLTFHHGLEVFTIMGNKGNTEWGYEKTFMFNLTFHHGFLVLTIMENQGNTEWDYEQKHSCLFNIPSWF